MRRCSSCKAAALGFAMRVTRYGRAHSGWRRWPSGKVESDTMHITRIEVIPLVRKLQDTFEGGTYRIVNRNTLVTRVHTDCGIGGEVFGGDEDMWQAEVVAVIRDHFAPM